MNTEEQQEIVSVKSYRPAEYVQESWPVVEVASVQSAFAPAQFEVVSTSSFVVDPMFSDFTKERTARPATPPQAQQFSQTSLVPPAEMGEFQQASDIITPFAEFARDNSTLESQQPDSIQVELEPSEELAGIQQEHEHPAEVHAKEGHGESEDRVAQVQLTSEEHEAALQAARQEGFAQGSAETEARVEQQCNHLQERCTLILEDLQSQSREVLEQHERQAIELALNVARRLVGSVVETQRDYIVSVIREALQATGGAQIQSIRVSPQDLEQISLERIGEQFKSQGDVNIKFQADETIKAGCVVVTSAGEVDFDLDAAWTRLRDKIVQGPQSE
jgi:flagellar assembly protein FliH